jgi:hypothetical protein
MSELNCRGEFCRAEASQLAAPELIKVHEAAQASKIVRKTNQNAVRGTTCSVIICAGRMIRYSAPGRFILGVS